MGLIQIYLVPQNVQKSSAEAEEDVFAVGLWLCTSQMQSLTGGQILCKAAFRKVSDLL